MIWQMWHLYVDTMGVDPGGWGGGDMKLGDGPCNHPPLEINDNGDKFNQFGGLW